MLGIAELVIMVAVGVSLTLLLVSVAANNRRKQAADNVQIPDDVYEVIRKRVERRFKRRGDFALHLVFFLLASLAFWFLIPMPKTAALWLSAAWGLVVVMHLVRLLFDEAQERAIDREVARVQGRDAEKPKREHLELGEDGELVEIVDDRDDQRRYSQG